MSFACIYMCIYIWQICSSMKSQLLLQNCSIKYFYWTSVNVSDMEKSSPCSVVLGEQGWRLDLVTGCRSMVLGQALWWLLIIIHFVPGRQWAAKDQYLSNIKDEEGLLKQNTDGVLCAWNVLSWPWDISVRKNHYRKPSGFLAKQIILVQSCDYSL